MGSNLVSGLLEGGIHPSCGWDGERFPQAAAQAVVGKDQWLLVLLWGEWWEETGAHGARVGFGRWQAGLGEAGLLWGCWCQPGTTVKLLLLDTGGKRLGGAEPSGRDSHGPTESQSTGDKGAVSARARREPLP